MSNIVPQKAITPLARNRAIELMKIGDEILIDSRIVAKGIEIEHRYFIRLLRKYQNRLENFGFLRFENAKTTPDEQGRGRPEIYALLNRNQIGFAITLSKNTEEAVNFKFDLIEALDIATRPLRPCSHRPELTPAQERELIKKYVQHVWDVKQEAPTAAILRMWIPRYDKRLIIARLEELVAQGEIISFTTARATKYKPLAL
jgi:hypothetical protein